MVRNDLIIILGDELRFLAIKTRERLCITQREMGGKHQMSESSYYDIETGKNKCNSLTAILLSLQEGTEYFINTVNKKFDRCHEKEMLTV